ncbi:MAG: polysaccharide biosynthesis tyrosine autokinase [Rectinemataceae bacterium]|nr:polysaccharide biosynthesis tyrosine autokinase [Rectinemataceae bacterium]
MKLAKALEKAKEERYSAECRQEEAQRPQQAKPLTGRTGWHSPDYTKSKSVSVCTETLAKKKCVSVLLDSREADAYKVLRTQIQQRAQERGWKTIMITSVEQGEGKTLTAINLAISMAKEFHQTVLLVDCDLKQQSIHQCLGYESKYGLADYLLDNAELSELIVWPGIAKLTVLSGGRTISGSTELLGSPRMNHLVKDMKDRYEDRYIIFDTPPILVGADAIAFAPFVDGIVVTVESGRTSMADVKRALTLLPKEKLLGFVLNRHSQGS